MIVRIDWISFSVEVAPAGVDDERKAGAIAARAIRDLSPAVAHDLKLDVGDWQPRSGRAPYKMAFHCEEVGATVYVHPRLTHALVEVSGRGCERLHGMGIAERFAQSVQTRVTRIDIACDMLCDTTPIEFCAAVEAGRFKSRSQVQSSSGETVYMGARASDRYARVYRYNAPHERSHLLRCEFVIKGQNAKLLAAQLWDDEIMSVAAALGEAFGWQHDDWQPTADAAELKAYRPDRKEGKTLFWLADTIAPLLRRLHQDGIIDAGEWFDTHVAQRLQ